MKDNYTRELEKKIHKILTAGEYHTHSLEELLQEQNKRNNKEKDIETKVQIFCFGMAFMLFLSAIIELYCN